MFACLVFARLAWNVHSLSTGKYLTRQGEIYAIDTFRSSRHFNIKRGYKTHVNEFNFYADKLFAGRFRFTIETSAYDVVREKDILTKLIKDTGHLFTIYSTKNALERYKETEKAFAITVEQVEIDGKKFIDISNANEERRRSLKRTSVQDALLLVIVGIIALLLFFRRKRNEKAS